MKIFLSWAGSEAQQLAIIFKDWLSMVIQATEPWISVDIAKGASWDKEIHTMLNESKIAILFLTKESIESKYLHYEAGAISNIQDAHPCTFLYNIKKADVKQPLSRFQATEFNKEDVRKLIMTIFGKIVQVNPSAGSEAAILKSFERSWEELKESIEKIKPATEINNKHEERTERDILEEILEGVRSLRKGDDEPDKKIVYLSDEPLKRAQEVYKYFKDNSGNYKRYEDYIKLEPFIINDPSNDNPIEGGKPVKLF